MGNAWSSDQAAPGPSEEAVGGAMAGTENADETRDLSDDEYDDGDDEEVEMLVDWPEGDPDWLAEERFANYMLGEPIKWSYLA